jgi:hypothetical protein
VIGLLLADHLRRLGGAYVAGAVLMTVVWVSLAAGMMQDTWALATSLVVVVVIGPLMGTADLSQREVRVLPLSGRQLWHAQWLLGIVIPAAVTATGRAVAVVVAPAIPRTAAIQPDTLALATLCDVAYLGLASGLLVVLTRRRWSGMSPRVARWVDIIATVALIGSIGWPILLGQYLPVHWSDLGGPAGVGIAAGLGLAAASYFLPPGPRSRAFTLPLPVTARPRRPARRWQLRRANGALSILRIVLVKCALLSLALGGVALLSGDMLSGSRAHGAQLWMFVAITTVQSDWRERLRQLRTLPMSAWHVNALLLATPLAVWVSVYLWLALLHRVMPAIGDGLSPALLAGIAGASALGDACMLQSRSRSRGWLIRSAVMLPVTLLAVGPYVNDVPPIAAWLVSATVGALTLAAAALLNHRALTRSSAIYKSAGSELGFAR